MATSQRPRIRRPASASRQWEHCLARSGVSCQHLRQCTRLITLRLRSMSAWNQSTTAAQFCWCFSDCPPGLDGNWSQRCSGEIVTAIAHASASRNLALALWAGFAPRLFLRFAQVRGSFLAIVARQGVGPSHRALRMRAGGGIGRLSTHRAILPHTRNSEDNRLLFTHGAYLHTQGDLPAARVISRRACFSRRHRAPRKPLSTIRRSRSLLRIGFNL